MAKIAICGYWRFSNVMEYLSQHHQIAKLFITPNKPLQGKLLQAAQSSDLVLQPIAESHLAELASLGVSKLYVGGYPHKIPECWPQYLEMAVNIHPSLLPEGRGPTAEPHLILNGAKVSGITLHKISPDWDGGDIIAQHSFEVSSTDTSASLLFKSRLTALELIKAFEADPQKQWANAKPQTSQQPYWQRHNKQQQTIDWHWPVERILKHLRAFANTGVLTDIGGQSLRLLALSGWQENHDHAPGLLLDYYLGGEMLVAALDGYIVIEGYGEPQ
jgi:methionyl-tRNA formyltransferase